MANEPQDATPAPLTSYEGYHEVKLSRAVPIDDIVYRAGVKHVVDDAVLKALGDAVIDVQPAR
ncbi:hypothetical protein [Methylovirgula sp. 4M-Z18]|uniref:hypothetical protein n=1 Tax=Methylovirgula sp. 4M-Z18 TaxID=2293567 RepID=UPI000E2F7F23|nr:hypothetical protein [Methylovirgula sp. 4M-Z18]RFB80397.1 hypothetical protein DYH55_02395 [Methylovirgula sp. 4M-Z18]